MADLPSLGPRGEGWVMIQFLLLPLVALSGLISGGAWSGTAAAFSALLGLTMMVGGGVLLARGLIDLGGNLTPVPRPRDDARLVEHGIYAKVRHPMYGALVLTSFGWGLVAASWLTLLLSVGLAVFFLLKSQREEAWLIGHYPGYADYMTRTRRFIPWVL